MSKNTEKKTKILTYQLTRVNSSLLFFAAKFRLKENMHLNIFLPETRVDQINVHKTTFTAM